MTYRKTSGQVLLSTCTLNIASSVAVELPPGPSWSRGHQAAHLGRSNVMAAPGCIPGVFFTGLRRVLSVIYRYVGTVRTRAMIGREICI